jgi:hypothetical protein
MREPVDLAGLGSALARHFGADVCAWVYRGQPPGDDPSFSDRLRRQGLLAAHPPPGCRPALMQEVARLLLVRDELLRATGALAHAGIDYCCIKGPALSQLIHGDACRRGSTDVDLVLDLSTRTRALDALQTAGYMHLATPYTHGNVEVLRHSHGGSTLELHFNLSSAERFQKLHDRMLTSREHVGVAGRSLAMPALEVHLAYLLVHLAKHAGGHLKLLWIHDIAELVTAQVARLDWAKFDAVVGETRVQTAVWLGSTMVRALLSSQGVPDPFPPSVTASLAGTLPRATRRLYASPFLGRLIAANPSPLWQRLHAFALAQDWSDRLSVGRSFLGRLMKSEGAR